MTQARLIATCALISALALLGACKQQAADGTPPAPVSAGGAQASGPAIAPEDVTIGFLVKQPEEPWFQNEWEFAEQCAQDYGFKLITLGTPDGEKVLSAIDNLAAQGAQGFVICTPDVHLGPAIMAKAEAANMKVFAVDDQLVGADGEFMDVPYMGISAADIGKSVGEAVWAEFVNRGWAVQDTGCCIVTYDELDTARERTEGAIAALIEAGFPESQIYSAPERTTDIPGALDAANIVLTQHPEAKHWLLASMNDEGVLGAVRAMEGRGFGADDVIGVGIGGTTALAEFQRDAPTGLFATALISPLRHGYETTEYMFKWITEGVEPPRDTRTAGIIVTRETCEDVMREQGLTD